MSSLPAIAQDLPIGGVQVARGRGLEQRVADALNQRADAVKWTLLAFEHVKAHTCGTRGHKATSAKNRQDAVLAFIEFTRKAPWEWGTGDVDRYFKALADKGLKLATRRCRQVNLRTFCNYVIADRTVANGMMKAFGKSVSQVITPLNCILHRHPNESDTHRQQLTYDEVELVFSRLDDAIEMAASSHCRSEHTLLRDKTINALMYGTGLREESIQRLSLHSFAPNPARTEFGNFGVVNVLGKGDKLNGVTLLDPAIAQMVEFYIDHVRSRFLRPGSSPKDNWGDALFLSERGTRIGKKAIYRAVTRAREVSGLAKPLFPHIWRHTYTSHSRPLQGADNTQKALAHTYQATTDSYSHLDIERTANVMDRAIQQTIDAAMRKDQQEKGP